ncbi:hypothetical protein VN12_06955 [Pirellula sp. SH-Sr6A]|nr:hypothetical protein VN12_06955 [Pirellula sp. SH-Sr6A]
MVAAVQVKLFHVFARTSYAIAGTEVCLASDNKNALELVAWLTAQTKTEKHDILSYRFLANFEST